MLRTVAGNLPLTARFDVGTSGYKKTPLPKGSDVFLELEAGLESLSGLGAAHRRRNPPLADRFDVGTPMYKKTPPPKGSGAFLELEAGLEPATYALRVRRSTD